MPQKTIRQQRIEIKVFFIIKKFPPFHHYKLLHLPVLEEVYLEQCHIRMFATVYKGNIIKNLIMDCQSYTKYRPNETTGGIFVSWRRKEELPTGA